MCVALPSEIGNDFVQNGRWLTRPSPFTVQYVKWFVSSIELPKTLSLHRTPALTSDTVLNILWHGCIVRIERVWCVDEQTLPSKLVDLSINERVVVMV